MSAARPGTGTATGTDTGTGTGAGTPPGAPPDPASAAQIAASDPGSSVWLVANAGSGKTKVLTDRVARLLLRGVPPQNVLCLTYTRAAAAEMQNRLFGRLGEWAMAPDGALRDHLATLGEGADAGPDALARARRLFARALETPGGIRIQTIHSFCAGLLRRFPLEAGVSPAFTELDPRSAALLRAEVLDELCSGPEAGLFEAIAARTGERVDALLAEIVSRRDAFSRAPSEAALRRAFGLPPGLDEGALLAATFLPGDAGVLAGAAGALAGGSVTDQGVAGILAAIGPLDLGAIDRLAGVFLYKSGAKAGMARLDRVPTKPTRTAMGAAALAPLQALMGRIEAAQPQRQALAAAAEALALHRFAAAFVARHEAAKARHGWFDFDDFIASAAALLTDPAVAPWVLYRLDGTIDHILIDEAQDTSPRQWRLIAALTEELTAGEGARERERSLFVVGDRKQSIYSFQGADVAAFELWHAHFARAFAQADRPFGERRLEHSFRSSRAILDLVDHTFEGTMAEALGGGFRHRAFHEDMPGRVEIWPPVPPPDKPGEQEWFDPVDLRGENDAATVLGRQIAERLRGLIEAGTMIPDRDGPRRLHAGDILVLVRRRGPVYRAIIRACKAAGLAMAGADRLQLTDELAVRDILSLLSFIDTPEDDLALAVALRSPLLGWDEARLFRLAHGRPGTLWEALRRAGAGGEALAMLTDLRDRADFLRPHELIERILIRHGGRARLLGRLGLEAAEAIDELLQQALAYEASEVPSLGGFLVWIAAGAVEVSRQAEAAGHAIRVMTVHGAKGLEAPVVILPDTADRRPREHALTFDLGTGAQGWTGPDAGQAAVAAKEARAAAQAAEDLRLLYVAMTRARAWLIVAAAGTCGEASWHGIISRGAQALGAAGEAGGGLTLATGDWPAPAGPADGEGTGTDAPVAPPPLAPLPPAPGRERVFSPSRLGGEALVAPAPAPAVAGPVAGGAWGEGAPGARDAVPPGMRSKVPSGVRSTTEPDAQGATEPDAQGAMEPDAQGAMEPDAQGAMERGTLLHLLLRHLPENARDAWPDLAARLGAGGEIMAEAAAIVTDPALAWLFGPGSQAEIEFSAPWAGGRIEGAIDRLVITPGRITVIDFKSNLEVPGRPGDIPEAYLRQLGAYLHAMEAIWPGRGVEAAILWTRTRRLMPVAAPLLRAALERAAADPLALADATALLDAVGGDT